MERVTHARGARPWYPGALRWRAELVARSSELALRLGFERMCFLNLTVDQAIESPDLPTQVDVVTALHACDTATDDAIRFALQRQARFIVLAPCCQAEVATVMRKHKNSSASRCAKARPAESVIPPAGQGTTILIARSG